MTEGKTNHEPSPHWYEIAMFLIGAFGGFAFGAMWGIGLMREHPDWVARWFH
jgi:hypothetical protein